MDDTNFLSSGGPLHLTAGVRVAYEGGEWVIVEIESLETALIRRIDGVAKMLTTVPIAKLTPFIPKAQVEAEASDLDLLEVSDADWEEARRRYDLIVPLVVGAKRRTAAIQENAAHAGVSVATLFNWYKRWLTLEKLSALLPTKRPGGAGRGRLSEEQERIMDEAINGLVARPTKVKISDVLLSIQSACDKLEIPAPSLSALKLRIEWRDQRELVLQRRGKKAAVARFDPIKTNTIRAEHPWSVVMIDHCVLDVVVVHDKTRQPIKRPWLTIAIDVYSRVVVGIYLSLRHPSATSVGACVSHAILPKEEYLKQIGSPISWPVWGTPRTLHMDNGADLRAERLAPSFREYLIERQYRPVTKPQYGAFIERLIGTFAKRMCVLPGATTNAIPEDRDYKPEDHAALTMEECERWLLEEINKYHHMMHRGIEEERPLGRYQAAFLQPEKGLPRALPVRRTDHDRVKVDFLPEFSRTIQRDGIRFEGRTYWHEVLTTWVGFRPPGSTEPSRHRFKTDDREINKIYFFDKSMKRWIIIPSSDLGAPPTSREEYRAAQKALAKQTGKKAQQQEVFGSVRRQQTLAENAIAATAAIKKERMQNEKKPRKPTKKELASHQKSLEKGRKTVATVALKSETIVSNLKLPDIKDLPSLDGEF